MLGVLVLLPLIAFLDYKKKKNNEPVQKMNKQLLIAGIICGTFLCIATTLQTIGMVYTSPGKSGFITAMYMVIVPIIGLFTGKRPNPVIAISVVVFGLMFIKKLKKLHPAFWLALGAVAGILLKL